MDINLKRLAGCQRVIGYYFADPSLLETALTHSSLRSPDRECNERLEFLGDSVLGLVITEELYHLLPDSAEGDMTRIKSAVVSRKSLYRASTRLDLAAYADYARGVGRRNELPTSVVANLVESIIGAIYLDAGYYPAREFVLRHLGVEIEDVMNDRGGKNYKSLLQHEVQQSNRATPHYRTVEEEGPDHDKVFLVAAVIQGREWGRSSGPNKKDAEQDAARKALEAWSRRGRGRRLRAADTEAAAAASAAAAAVAESAGTAEDPRPAEAPAAPKAEAEPAATREPSSRPRLRARRSSEDEKPQAVSKAKRPARKRRRGRGDASGRDASAGEAQPVREAARPAPDVTKPAREVTKPAVETPAPAKAAPQPAREAPQPAKEVSQTAKDTPRADDRAPTKRPGRPPRKTRARRAPKAEPGRVSEQPGRVSEQPAPAAASQPEPTRPPQRQPDQTERKPEPAAPDSGGFGDGIFDGPAPEAKPAKRLAQTRKQEASTRRVKGRVKAPTMKKPRSNDGFAI